MFEQFKSKFNILKEDIIHPDIIAFYIKKEDIKPALNYLKDSSKYLFERLDCIYAEDNGHVYIITYVLHSDKYNIKCTIKCELNYDEKILSVSDIFKSANFDEREIYDLFGINFLNHPNLKRILLPESFKGHPLRKDYEMNDERLRWNYEHIG